MIRNITPGIPNNPAIKAVTALIPIVIPKGPPTKFISSNSIPPAMALITNFINIFNGHASTLPIISKNSTAMTKYIAVCITKSPFINPYAVSLIL